LAVLREAVESGVNHIDTSDFYGPHITNQIIKQALHPYRKDLTIVTKVGARRGDDSSWILDTSSEFLKKSIHDNLRNLGLDVLPIVNLRVGGVSEPSDVSITEPLTVLAELQQQGLIQHIGLSNVSQKQFDEARPNSEDRVRAELLQCGTSRRRPLSGSPQRRRRSVRSVLPAWWLHAVTVVNLRRCGFSTAYDTYGCGSGLAPATCTQHPTDSWHIFCSSSAREHLGRIASPPQQILHKLNEMGLASSI